MIRISRWPASIAARALAAVAVLGIIALGTSPQTIVKADTPFAFTIACMPSPANTQQTVTCTATQTMGTSGSALSYLWSFGDSSAAATGNPVMHQYTAAGMFTVTATAATMTGNVQATAMETVTAALQVKISGPAAGSVGQQLTYTVAAASGATVPSDTIYTWDFGDGTSTATGASVTHVYTTSGTYTIKVTANSVSGGTSGTDTLKVVISAGSQQLTLSLSPLTATAAQAQSFSVSATGTVPSDVVYSINWGDSTSPSTGATASHTYANAGTFGVTVSSTSVSNPASNTMSTFMVVVSAAPTPQPTGPTQTFGPGWNLVSGPAGTVVSQANGPLYTFPAGATAYTSVPNSAPLQNGVGYWAYFSAAATITLSGTPPALPFTAMLPPNQYVMIGNPSPTQAVTVTGADVVYAYDPASGYAATTTLRPGQGAWAFSANGGPVTIR
jgi:PKD repeat protein